MNNSINENIFKEELSLRKFIDKNPQYYEKILTQLVFKPRDNGYTLSELRNAPEIIFSDDEYKLHDFDRQKLQDLVNTNLVSATIKRKEINTNQSEMIKSYKITTIGISYMNTSGIMYSGCTKKIE